MLVNLEWLGYRTVKKIAEKFNRLSAVHERHRQTTDTIAVPLAELSVTFG